MKLRIQTSAQLDPVLRRMAKEADITVEKLAQIAIYNIVSLWAAEKREVAAQGGTDTPEIFAVPSVGNGHGPMHGWFVGGNGD